MRVSRLRETLGGQLEYLRGTRCLSQYDIAVATFIAGYRIDSFEKDKLIPSRKELYKIVEALGIEDKGGIRSLFEWRNHVLILRQKRGKYAN